jgi:hypothetical protein
MSRQILQTHTHIIKNRSFELNKLVLRYHDKEMPYSSSLGLTVRTPKGTSKEPSERLPRVRNKDRVAKHHPRAKHALPVRAVTF